MGFSFENLFSFLLPFNRNEEIPIEVKWTKLKQLIAEKSLVNGKIKSKGCIVKIKNKIFIYKYCEELINDNDFISSIDDIAFFDSNYYCTLLFKYLFFTWGDFIKISFKFLRLSIILLILHLFFYTSVVLELKFLFDALFESFVIFLILLVLFLSILLNPLLILVLMILNFSNSLEFFIPIASAYFIFSLLSLKLIFNDEIDIGKFEDLCASKDFIGFIFKILFIFIGFIAFFIILFIFFPFLGLSILLSLLLILKIELVSFLFNFFKKFTVNLRKNSFKKHSKNFLSSVKNKGIKNFFLKLNFLPVIKNFIKGFFVSMFACVLFLIYYLFFHPIDLLSSIYPLYQILGDSYIFYSPKNKNLLMCSPFQGTMFKCNKINLQRLCSIYSSTNLNRNELREHKYNTFYLLIAYPFKNHKTVWNDIKFIPLRELTKYEIKNAISLKFIKETLCKNSGKFLKHGNY